MSKALVGNDIVDVNDIWKMPNDKEDGAKNDELIGEVHSENDNASGNDTNANRV